MIMIKVSADKTATKYKLVMTKLVKNRSHC
jgi:hypothetical protein